MRVNEIWPPERMEELKGLVAKGLSSSKIGAILGITRNAVIGKSSRMGLRLLGPKGEGNRSCGNRARRQQQKTLKARVINKKKNRRLPPWLRAELKDANAPEPLRIPTGDLGYHHCRSVVHGETGPYCEPLYCGHYTPDATWCNYHHFKYTRRVR